MVEKFKAAFIAHVPDADSNKHRSIIKTSLYKLISVLVKNDDEAIEVCKELVQKEKVHAFILCPGFTHKAIARILDTVGNNVSSIYNNSMYNNTLKIWSLEMSS